VLSTAQAAALTTAQIASLPTASIAARWALAAIGALSTDQAVA
jgi:hypothetical protein